MPGKAAPIKRCRSTKNWPKRNIWRGNFFEAEQLCTQGIAAATDNLAKITLILVQSEQYQLQKRHSQSVRVLRQGLALLGHDKCDDEQRAAELLPGMIAQVEKMLASIEASNLMQSPEMTGLEQLLSMQLHCQMLIDLSATSQYQFYGLCACQMVMLSVNHGQCDLSAIGFRAFMAVIAMATENHGRAYQLGKLAIELADHRRNNYHRASVYQIFSSRYLHWREPLQNANAYLQQVIRWGQEGINLSEACSAVVMLNICRFIKGTELPTLEVQIQKGLNFIRQVEQANAEHNVLVSTLQPVLALQDKTPHPLSFDSETVMVERIFKCDFDTPSNTLALYSYAMLRHAYLMSHRVDQKKFIHALPLVVQFYPDSPLDTDCTFYTALALLGFSSPGELTYVENIKRIKRLSGKLRQWAEISPQNYRHKHLIVSAELARVCGDIESATTLFDEAIEACEEAGFIHCEALANELFAHLWQSENQSRVAKTFIKEAHHLYQRWGAIAKCEQIEEAWPDVIFHYSAGEAMAFDQKADDGDEPPAMPGHSELQRLFNASQQMARELHIDPLVNSMLTIMLENTHAQFGALVFDDDSQLRVEAIGSYNGLENKVDCRRLSTTLAEACAEDPPLLPGSMIRYVQQTREALQLNSPVEDVRFSHNGYLQERLPQSVLVLPVKAHGKLMAIVYLENSHSQHSFTPHHLQMLELLAPQAAIALNNAALFSSMKAKIQKRKDQLNREREKADKANETKSLFLANMSHEIRTPLTTVIGFAEGILFGDIEKKNHQQAIQTIANSGKHLLLLINDILDFSKIEAGQLQVERINVNLIELLTNLESISTGMVKSKTIEFKADYHLPIPDIISTDPTRLNQILLNLISNAVKFTEQGGVTLQVFVKGQQLIFKVIDTGVGIRPEKIASLFYAFEQADKTVQRKYGGTGLGLTISKSLAQMLGGDIICESEPGTGSTFTLAIELSTAAQTRQIECLDELRKAQNAMMEANKPQVSHLEGNILVAEDQPENLQLIMTMLEKMGLTVTGVANGKEAVEAYLIDDFDLILLDIQMPIMDGLETFEMLQSLSNDTPVIALTANAMKHEVDEYFRKGFDEHLAKPIERKPFIEKISRFLGQSAEHVDATLSDEELHILQEQFAANLPAYLDRITQHLRAKDWLSLQHDAHSLKGAAGMLGFTELSEAASHLEQDLKANELTPVEAEVAELIELATTQMEI